MHSIIGTEDAGGVRADGSSNTTETDHFTEHLVEDFMRKGHKGGVRTRDFESMTASGNHPKRCRMPAGKKLPPGRYELIDGKWKKVW